MSRWERNGRGKECGDPFFLGVIPAKAVPRNAGQELPAFAGNHLDPGSSPG
jgi:hypothetical protein